MSKETLEELVENFSIFDEWEERYRYLIDLGRKIPKLDESLKLDEYLVKGCTSSVWLIAEVKDGILTFQTDSDAHIVRGLTAILDAAYQGKGLTEIAAVDIRGAFEQIGMDQHLSANRRSGFYAMVEKIRSYATV